MSDIVIVADSIACIPTEQAEHFKIRIVPANIFFNGNLYRDMIDLTSAQAYDFLDKAPQFWRSSAASPEDYAEAYRELRNAHNILVITISSKLSMFCVSAKAAKEIIQKELPSTVIEIMDSETAAAAEGLIVLAAARAASEGKAFEEVVTIAREVKERVRFLGLLETIRHVYRTGRIPKIASQVGSLLSLKPILTDGNGVISIAGASRTKEHGIEKMLNMMKKQTGYSEPIHVAIMHADANEEAQMLKERIATEFNCEELFITDFSPIMAYATGRGTLALAFYKSL
ncbi:DegV family protein [Chloroflexota bacterium]